MKAFAQRHLNKGFKGIQMKAFAQRRLHEGIQTKAFE